EGAGEAVYVAGQKDGTITRLDPISGERLGSKHVAALGKPAAAPVVQGVRLEQRPGASILRFTLAGGQLRARDLVVRDGAIADGRASLELWQGGISSRTTGGLLGPLTLHITRATGRLVIDLRAHKGTFTRLRAERSDGRTVLVTLTKRKSAAAKTAPPT